MKTLKALFFAGCATLVLTPPLAAREAPLSTRDSFRIGDAGVLCTAQYAPADTRLKGIFDRSYQLVCRDAASAVGSLFAVRGDMLPTAAALQCDAPSSASIERVGAVEARACRDGAAGLDYRRYSVRKGVTTYVAEGLAGYDSALQVGLAALVADQPVPGNIQVATTLISDPAAFARVQAGQLDARGARREAYGRNSEASFAQAAAFFESLSLRPSDDASDTAEFIANQGLQQANLGNFAAADALFNRAERLTPARDGVTQRMIRNFRAINALGRNRPADALSVLDAAVAPVKLGRDDDLISGSISQDLAKVINRENETLKSLGGIESGLTAEDRAAILDAQALQLRGEAQRQQGQYAPAAASLGDALAGLEKVREGRVVSVAWLKAQILADLAAVAEQTGDSAGADRALAQAVEINRISYPQTPALLASMARRAGFLSRAGRADEALALFGQVVDSSETVEDAGAALQQLVKPYFSLLASRGDTASGAAMFKASQLVQRPGIAQTQAVLSRELSEGNDEAAALFRLSIARSRDIARTSAEIEQLSAKPNATPEEAQKLAEAREALDLLAKDQTAIQSKLSAFPRYRAAAPSRITLEELQRSLKSGEAYYKFTLVDDVPFAQLITEDAVQSFAIASSKDDLASAVAGLRNSIVRMENGTPVVDPFDIRAARDLFKTLLGPVEAQLPAISHLVFEPDGPLLQLPPYLLVMDDASVTAYEKRLKRAGADEFDFTGTKWLGRDRAMSIAVSPRAFADVRTIAKSRGSKAYLGLGQNEKAFSRPVLAAADECDWPIETWQNPISGAELELANSIVGRRGGAVLTDAAFSDTALAGASDLNQYRILHFATHGLVTAPRPQCPARPALVTSFGGGNSDGLLSFREVFDLKLDADLVILSACDTAGMATAAATREAGITTGGNYALDGLVRAFVGAGARSVLASHWPVPDDFDATNRLIGGLFRAKPGVAMADALRATQRGLMDDADTSHPFYWAAFVILGDGQKSLVE